jgi:hypothetical protein
MKCYRQALQLDPKYKDAWHRQGLLYLRRFVLSVVKSDLAGATQSWNNALSSIRQSEHTGGWNLAAKLALFVVYRGELDYVRYLLNEPELEASLFPLARAIDYLQTGDEALIEKLSPEVRGIVEEVVAKLKETSQSGS